MDRSNYGSQNPTSKDVTGHLYATNFIFLSCSVAFETVEQMGIDLEKTINSIIKAVSVKTSEHVLKGFEEYPDLALDKKKKTNIDTRSCFSA
jgi:hypothetical protein